MTVALDAQVPLSRPATSAAQRIVGTWPASPKGFIWTEQLLELDAGIARAAVDQLTREHEESRLPVARYLAVYRAITNAGNTDRHTDNGRPADAISFAEYVARLTWRAGTGDTDAATTLAMWADLDARGLTRRWVEQ